MLTLQNYLRVLSVQLLFLLLYSFFYSHRKLIKNTNSRQKSFFACAFHGELVPHYLPICYFMFFHQSVHICMFPLFFCLVAIFVIIYLCLLMMFVLWAIYYYHFFLPLSISLYNPLILFVCVFFIVRLFICLFDLRSSQ